MRTNLFKFKKLKKEKIVLEEEKLDNPFLSFLKHYKKYILLLLFLLGLISIIIAVYSAVKNLTPTTKEFTNIKEVSVDFEDSSEVKVNSSKPITGGQANKSFYERYGNIGLKEGIIFSIKEIDSENGKIIFYSDYSAKLIKKDGTILRIASLKDGSYGITEKGVMILGVATKEIAVSNTLTLKDNTIIKYYSDGSAEIYYPDHSESILVRNSERINISNDKIVLIDTSGVSNKNQTTNKTNYKITYYDDGTIKIEKDNNIYIVRSSNDVVLNEDSFTFPNNNAATLIDEISFNDNTIIKYYSDGSAEIINNGTSIIVRKSKDIIYDTRILEITETKYAKEVSSKVTSDSKIIYLDNGGALIENSDGTYEYVLENSDIKYNDDNSIKSINNVIKEISHKELPDGTIVIDLEDGTSIVIDKDGYMVVDTDNIIYDSDGNIAKILTDEDNKDDAISNNRFVITNNSGNKINYMVTIELSDNYKAYAPKWLDPKFLRFNIIVNSTYLENQLFKKVLPIGTTFEGNAKITKETYILYQDVLEDNSKADIDLGIWLDYEEITNEYQDSVFVGTVKIYSETIK